jgi:hypothetical protein
VKTLAAALSRLFDTSLWRDIKTAPFDRELELGIDDGEVRPVAGSYFRHETDWFDAETLTPIKVNATHWRSRWSVIVPVSCC